MKILLLPSYFQPEQMASSQLNDHRYRAFAEMKYEMLVYAPFPTRGITDEIRNEYKKRNEEIIYNGKMEVHRFSMFREGNNSIIRALRYTLCWCKQFFYGCRAKGIDLIYLASTPPIQGALGVLLKKIKNKPFIYNLQDIFPDSLVGTGMTRTGSLLWKIGRVIEDFTYRNADKIIVISQDFKRNIMEKGVPEEKIEVIYNWVEQDAVVDIPREQNKLFDIYNLDRSKFYIEYSGNIGLTQNFDMLIEVMAELQLSHPDIHLVLVGDGAYKFQTEKMVAEKMLKNVTMLPFQPYEDISHVLSLGDIGLVVSKPGVGANSVPSKTWSIMSASRPVLANFDENELKDIIDEHKCGIFTKAGDKAAFIDAIIKLYHNRDLCRVYGRNGRQFVMDNLTREVGTQKYVDIIKEVCNQKR